VNKNDLLSLVANDITTNANNEITGAILANVLTQSVNSSLNLDDGDSRLENYSVSNNSGVISNILAAGTTLNTCTLLLESGETAIGQNPVYRNVAGTSQATYLDETNDKFLFPSNLNTYSTAYTQYDVRVTLVIDHPAVSTNQSIMIKCSIKREVDDSVVSEVQHLIHHHPVATGEKVTLNFKTFVNTEADPYVVDGMYIALENMALSSGSFTLTEFDFRLFKS